MTDGELLIRFLSPDFQEINSKSISVPTNATSVQLKAVLCGLTDSTEAGSAEFDFLISGQLLRSSIDHHLKENGIETDNEIEITVLKRQIAPVPEHSYSAEDWISDVAALGDKALIASYDGTVSLWDASEEEIIFQLVCSRDVSKADPLKCCIWLEEQSSGDVQFVTGGIDSDLTVWQWNNDRSKKPHPIYSLRGHHGSVETVTSVSKDTICSAGQDKHIKLWKDISSLPSNTEEISGKKRAKRDGRGDVKTTDLTLKGHSEAVTCSAMISDTELATGGMDNTLRIWDLAKMEESNTLSGVKAFFALDYSPRSKLIATGSSDRHVRLWDPRTTTGRVSATSLTSHSLWVSAVKWNPFKDHQLVSGSYDNVLKMWDVRSTKTPLFDMQKHDDKILCVDWSTSNLVFSGGTDQMIHSYRVN